MWHHNTILVDSAHTNMIIDGCVNAEFFLLLIINDNDFVLLFIRMSLKLRRFGTERLWIYVTYRTLIKSLLDYLTWHVIVLTVPVYLKEIVVSMPRIVLRIIYTLHIAKLLVFSKFIYYINVIIYICWLLHSFRLIWFNIGPSFLKVSVPTY